MVTTAGRYAPSPSGDLHLGNLRTAMLEAVLGVVPRIVLASVCGYLLGEFLNSYVMVKLKERAHERRLWVRLVSSTVVGEFFDTTTFCLIAGPAIGISGVGQLANYTILGWVIKTAVEVILMPITYRVIAAVKRREPTYAVALKATEEPALSR